MATRDIIVVGSSAGGVETLGRLMALLPGDLPAAMFIVQHMSPESPRLLSAILDRAGELSVAFAEDGAEFERSRVYVAPPDRHLLLSGNRMVVTKGPRENRHRPAIDPLFRSAAISHTRRVIGVVLTGTLDDGAAGLWAIRTHGGVAVVQDPADALYPGMPRSALEFADVDYCLALSDIGQLLSRLSREPIDDGHVAVTRDTTQLETDFAMGNGDFEKMKALGTPSTYSCPACGGSLWEIKEGDSVRFRCHIGHAFQIPSLLVEQTRAIEGALEAAQRALEEKAAVLRRLAQNMDRRPDQTFADRAQAADESAATVRRLLMAVRE
ncbi:MAG TPA: chemotaxis protein CheB [Gemmatimonadaceae bacterium]|nr:chemotaxis protein CheB [Gemmatimonadaceae bacterium]